MNKVLEKIEEIISSVHFVLLSVVATSFTALFLSSLENKMDMRGISFFDMQTSFSYANYAYMIKSIGESGKKILIHYIALDCLFMFLGALCISAIVSLFLRRNIEQKEESEKKENKLISQFKKFVYIILPIGVAAAVLGNGLMYSSLVSSQANSWSHISIAVLYILRMAVFSVCLLFVFYMIIKRRKYRKAVTQ